MVMGNENPVVTELMTDLTGLMTDLYTAEDTDEVTSLIESFIARYRGSYWHSGHDGYAFRLK